MVSHPSPLVLPLVLCGKGACASSRYNPYVATTVAFPETECVGITIDGKFPLLRWLGGTRQSSVFLTQLEGNPSQKAAIKFSPVNAADAETRIGERAGHLSHPHLMRVFHTGRWRADGVDLLYVVTEYADEILSDVLRDRALNPEETREMLGTVVEALAWLHGQGLVHGHLKPSNIMVAGEQLKLSSDRLHVPGELGWASSSSGKYDAPEATLLTMSPQADVWSLGMVLVEALTQWPPRWDGRDDPIVPPFLPAPLSGIARGCLRVDPARRTTLTGIRNVLNPPRGQPAKLTDPSHARAVVATASLAVIGIGITLFAVFHPRPSSPAAAPAPAAAAASPAPTFVSPARAVERPAPALVRPAPAVVPSVHPQPTPRPTPPPPRPQVPARQVSAGKGAVANQVLPNIPQHILDTVQGHIRVGIGVDVDADGKVSAATLDTPGPSRYFANQALEAAKRWTFRPADQNGRAAATRWTLLFRFAKDGTTVTATQTSP